MSSSLFIVRQKKNFEHWWERSPSFACFYSCCYWNGVFFVPHWPRAPHPRTKWRFNWELPLIWVESRTSTYLKSTADWPFVSEWCHLKICCFDLNINCCCIREYLHWKVNDHSISVMYTTTRVEFKFCDPRFGSADTSCAVDFRSCCSLFHIAVKKKVHILVNGYRSKLLLHSRTAVWIIYQDIFYRNVVFVLTDSIKQLLNKLRLFDETIKNWSEETPWR